jgi:hypothetical protein
MQQGYNPVQTDKHPMSKPDHVRQRFSHQITWEALKGRSRAISLIGRVCSPLVRVEADTEQEYHLSLSNPKKDFRDFVSQREFEAGNSAKVPKPNHGEQVASLQIVS